MQLFWNEDNLLPYPDLYLFPIGEAGAAQWPVTRILALTFRDDGTIAQIDRLYREVGSQYARREKRDAHTVAPRDARAGLRLAVGQPLPPLPDWIYVASGKLGRERWEEALKVLGQRMSAEWRP